MAPTSSHPRLRFLVHKHAARRLHYDLRLEWDGVLKSWAVPKGPSLDPADKRLAVAVADHPLEYGTFEGTIPEGEYGAGAVMLWDRGTWTPLEDPRLGLRKGRLRFTLHGKKLRGAWDLVRMRPRGGEEQASWLLIKERDGEARTGRAADVTARQPGSVASGRSIEEIAANAPRRSRTRARMPKPRARARLAARRPAVLPAPRKAPLPRRISPELATLVTHVPTGDDWLFETKFDGYRILACVERRRARLLSRNGKDWTDRFAPIAAALARLRARQAVLDGEMVVLERGGRTDFQALQNTMRSGRTDRLVYFAFDLLHLDGFDLTRLPLIERKRRLEALLAPLGAKSPVRYSAHVEGHGEQAFRRACDRALEGVIAKRKDASYRPGRGTDWLKLKCVESQEFVVVGWTDPAGKRTGFGALLLGVYDRRGKLVYAGKVGTGFDDAFLKELTPRLKRLARPRSPLAVPPREKAHWVAPSLVAEVDFTDWTRDGRLRHPSFRGLREDKPARSVVRETREAPPKPRVGRTVRLRRAHVPPAERGRATAPPRASEERVAGVVLSHPDRVVYPTAGVTKLELARYYETVAARMLPHVVERPLMILRCPDGEGRPCFYQKNVTSRVPPGLAEVTIPDLEGGPPSTYLRIKDVRGLIALVQMGVLEIHVWSTVARRLERPDRTVFDLDPGAGVTWAGVVSGARAVRDELERRGLKSFVKTTGGKGVHVVAPITPGAAWSDVRAFARGVAETLARVAPKRFVAQSGEARRRGKIFVDYLRNGRGATWVAPYSARARKGAPVSMPISWDDLTAGHRPARWTVRTVPPLGDRDAWQGIARVRQLLPPAEAGRPDVERPIEPGRVRARG